MSNQSTRAISIKKAALLNAGAKYIGIIWNLALTAVLARLLTPQDYGVVAVTTVFTNFFTLFADMGLGAGVIQNQTLSKNEISDIYSCSVYLAVMLGVVFAFFSIPLSIFYGNEVYRSIGLLLAVALFFTTLNTVPNAVLMKNKQFVKVAVRNIVAPITTGVIAVVLAYAGWKYYALVWQSVLSCIVVFLWNYVTAHMEYGLEWHIRFEKKGLKKIFSFSGYQFAFSFVNYFSRNLDNLLISKFMGEKLLGYYDKAYKLMLYPVGNLTHVITPVLLPILSEYQDDKEYVYQKYMKVVSLLSVLGIFITAFCFLAGEEIIMILFGSQWSASVPCFTALSLSVWAQMITSSAGCIFQSMGCTKSMFKSCLINTCITIIAIFTGISSGSIQKLAGYVSLAYQLHFISSFYLLMRDGFRMKYRRFLKQIYGDIIFLLILIFCAYFCPLSYGIESIWMSIIVKGLYIAVLYAAGLFVTKKYRVFGMILSGKRGRIK